MIQKKAASAQGSSSVDEEGRAQAEQKKLSVKDLMELIVGCRLMKGLDKTVPTTGASG